MSLPSLFLNTKAQTAACPKGEKNMKRYDCLAKKTQKCKERYRDFFYDNKTEGCVFWTLERLQKEYNEEKDDGKLSLLLSYIGVEFDDDKKIVYTKTLEENIALCQELEDASKENLDDLDNAVWSLVKEVIKKRGGTVPSARRSASTGVTASGVAQRWLMLRIDKFDMDGSVQRRKNVEYFDVPMFQHTLTDTKGRQFAIDGITTAAEELMRYINKKVKWLNELHIGSELVAKRSPDAEQRGWQAYDDQRKLLQGNDAVVVDRIGKAIRALWSQYPNFTVCPIHLTCGLDVCAQQKWIKEIGKFPFSFFYKPRADWFPGPPTRIRDDSYIITRNNYGRDDPEFQEKLNKAVKQYQEDLDEAALIEFMIPMYSPTKAMRIDIEKALEKQLGKKNPGTKPTIVSSGVEGDDYAVLAKREPMLMTQTRGYKFTYPDWSPDDRKLNGALGKAIQRYFVKAALRDDRKEIRISFECPCPT